MVDTGRHWTCAKLFALAFRWPSTNTGLNAIRMDASMPPSNSWLESKLAFPATVTSGDWVTSASRFDPFLKPKKGIGASLLTGAGLLTSLMRAHNCQQKRQQRCTQSA